MDRGVIHGQFGAEEAACSEAALKHTDRRVIACGIAEPQSGGVLTDSTWDPLGLIRAAMLPAAVHTGLAFPV